MNVLDRLNNDIIENNLFKAEKNEVFSNYINYLVGAEFSLDRKIVKNLSTSIQFFYKSEVEEIKKEGAILLAMLLDMAVIDHPDLAVIAKKIFIESGDFPNIKLLNDRYSTIDIDYGFYNNAQNIFKESLNTVQDLEYPLTDFQRILWKNLKLDKDIITIAPTSAGKTHIILTYLVRQILLSDGAFAAIVVPTRALISEVANKVYEISKSFNSEREIEICTVPKDTNFKDKTIFVMTQERLYEVLQSGDLSFNYLFIDEAHNISDPSRGVLLHLTIDKLLENSLPQIILSMPSDSYKNSFSSIFNEVDFIQEITRHSPVSKILMSVKLVGREIVISRYKNDFNIKIPKNFKGNKLSDLVLRLGQGQSNIIYKNRTDYCENTAGDIADLMIDFVASPELEEAADYIEKFVHEDFSLASNLRKGVAFHYGPLPSSVRVMIERLAKEDLIKYIVCTSTLAEGVNLPAKNLFLENPLQPVIGKESERLEDVKINNITGRAGRMIEHFSGNIFLIDPESWRFKDYFEEKEEENYKIPTYYRTLNENFFDVLAALSGSYSHSDENQYSLYTIANKLIRDFLNDNLISSLGSKDLTLPKTDLDELISSVKTASENLNIAPYLLQANPTIGYIQQNKLFNFFDGLNVFDDWVLPHPKSIDLYDRLIRVVYKLNEVGVYIASDNYSIEFIVTIATKWVSGKSLKEIISEQVIWDKDNRGEKVSTNTSVRNVIKVINSDIRFRLANALSCYHLLLSNQMQLKDINKTTVKIHTYLEIGACDDRMINLINLGLSREAAKEIDDKLENNVLVSDIYELVRLLENGDLENIHSITKKEIKYISN
ncbi:DEAD/DEAH box helicase [Acinetobacter baumannii]|uniref:DEAD/DEAH box helicase n=1 Tax=Acinetobacter baumannii TaxID=470 RepID=UPI000D3C206B|nr:DEAD/DEAH box helicase [Acinetobacter baumannii]MDV7653551.1 DEAD/DEAH box helicase [Acinetobacter baumannii]PUU97499.1 RNA helicase [Acinetobacter baumannii]